MKIIHDPVTTDKCVQLCNSQVCICKSCLFSFQEINAASLFLDKTKTAGQTRTAIVGKTGEFGPAIMK